MHTIPRSRGRKRENIYYSKVTKILHVSFPLAYNTLGSFLNEKNKNKSPIMDIYN